MRRVLLTGANGGIGTRLRTLLRGIYPELILSDLNQPHDLAADENFVQADLADFSSVAHIVQGVDGIIHLGGFSVEGPWETILQANIVGCYNLFEAARRAKVRRVVFASSNHAMGFYPRTQTVGSEEHVRPDSRYGVSKAFGEALGSMYADKHGMGVFCIRIGNVDDQPVDERRLAIWLRPDDLVQLIRIGLERPGIHYEIVYGMSDNKRAWWDNTRARELGYAPKGVSEDYATQLIAAELERSQNATAAVLQGGGFCSDELTSPMPPHERR